MDYKEIAIYALGLVQILVIYIYRTHVQENKEDFEKLETKMEKIQTGDFVKEIVKNVIYSPESRTYFKSIFTEALNHQSKNDNSAVLAILDHLESIEKKLIEEKSIQKKLK